MSTRASASARLKQQRPKFEQAKVEIARNTFWPSVCAPVITPRQRRLFSFAFDKIIRPALQSFKYIFGHRSAPTTAQGYRRSVPRYRRKLHKLPIVHCHFARELLPTVRLDAHVEAKSSWLRARGLILGFPFPSDGAATTTEKPSDSSTEGHLVSPTVLRLRRLPNWGCRPGSAAKWMVR
jgi:hypothetical protein